MFFNQGVLFNQVIQGPDGGEDLANSFKNRKPIAAFESRFIQWPLLIRNPMHLLNDIQD